MGSSGSFLGSFLSLRLKGSCRTLYEKREGPKPIENWVTCIFWARAATKWPHSCTVTIAAKTASALATLRGPAVSNPVPAIT